MIGRTQTQSWHRIIGYVWLGFVLPVTTAAALDGIVTDGTMGAGQTLGGANVTIPQDLGSTVGANLFHSFAEFNIASGQTVEFTGSDALQNVISRVTGPDASTIDGTLKSSIANAAFYFINPNGVTFGAHASVDVPGAFHVGAADKIDFPNNGAFYADSSRNSTLSSEMPAAFGFLGTSAANNGLLKIDGARLEVKPEQTLEIAARQVSIENSATLSAPSGAINVEAVEGVNLSSSTLDAGGNGAGRLAVHGGNVKITDSDLLSNNLGDTDTPHGRGIDITADKLNVTAASRIHANVFGQGRGGDINIAAAGDFQLNDSTVRAAVLPGAAGHGGNIKVNAKALGIDSPANAEAAINVLTAPDATGTTGSVEIITERLTLRNQAYISSDTYGPGNTSPVNITSRRINLASGALIESSAWRGSTGNASRVNIKTDTLKMDNNAQIYSFAIGSGNAGPLTVESTGLLNMRNGASIENSTKDGSTGDAGDIAIKAGALNMADNAWIFSTTQGTGKAGNIAVASDGLLSLRNGASIQNFTLFGSADAGNINVNAGAITMAGLGATVTAISSNTLSAGQAGDITVEAAGPLDIADGAIIASNTAATGNAGNVAVKSAAITIAGEGKQTGIYSDTFFSSGKTGNVSVESTGMLNITNGGIIGTLTTASGDARNVSVSTGELNIDAENNDASNTGIYSGPAFSCGNVGACTGKAGIVDVEAVGAIAIRNGGFISNSTFSDGDAGSINVNADSLVIEGSDGALTGIYANSFSSASGKGGNIDINSEGELSLLHGGVIDTSTFGSGKAGDITIKAETLNIDGLRLNRLGFPEPSGIFSAATPASNGQTGNIAITADNVLNLSNQGKISIENRGAAEHPSAIHPGTITVSAPNIHLSNAGIAANSTANVSAGSIAVYFSRRLLMDTSYISTEAFTGNGGSITIDGGELARLKNSGFFTTVYRGGGYGGDILFKKAEILLMDSGVIQANAVGGSGGNITLNQKVLIPSGNTLLLAGEKVNWQPFVPGFNVIQAASTFGVSGNVNITAPQLNLSGILANLGGPQFDIDSISQDYCEQGTGSSLTRRGTGGLKPKSGELLFFRHDDCR